MPTYAEVAAHGGSRSSACHPYKITVAHKVRYRDSSGREQSFDFLEGTTGVAYGYDRKIDCYCVSVPGRAPAVAYIRAATAEVNRQLDMYQERWSIAFNNPNFTPFQPPRSSVDGQLWIAVNNFCHALKNSSTMASLLSPRAVDLLRTSQHIGNFCTLLCEGTKRANLLTVFNSPNFQLSDIVDKAQECREVYWTTKSPSNKAIACIYLFEHIMPDGSRYLYVGSTLDVGRRCGQHRRAAKDEKANSMNYRQFRDSRKSRCFILCHIDPKYHDTGEQLLAELFFMAMGLETYAKCMSEHDNESIAAANSFDMVDKIYEHQARLESDTVDEDNGELGLDQPNVFAEYNVADDGTCAATKRSRVRHIMQRIAVFHMKHAVQEAKQATQWPGGLSRKSFSSSPAEGCNMATPLFTDQDQRVVTWSKVTATKDGQPHMDIYSRPAMTVWADKRSGYNRVTLFTAPRHPNHNKLQSGKKGKRILASWKSDTEPVKGRKVFIVIEVMRNHDKPHPFQYARLPLLDEATDSGLARAMAISMVFHDGKSWQKKYVQHGLVNQVSRANVPSKPYCEAISIIRSLQEEQLFTPRRPQGQMPACIGWFGASHVFKLHFDWLKQQLCVDTGAATRQQPLGTLFTREQRTQLLVTAGATGYGMAHKQFKGEKRRTHCDLCFTNVSEAKKGQASESILGGHKGCELAKDDPKGKSCICCYYYANLECTWTDSRHITGRLKALFINPTKAAHSLLVETEEPRFFDLRDPERQNITSTS